MIFHPKSQRPPATDDPLEIDESTTADDGPRPPSTLTDEQRRILVDQRDKLGRRYLVAQQLVDLAQCHVLGAARGLKKARKRAERIGDQLTAINLELLT